MIEAVAPREAKARLHFGAEIAFLDVREAGEFGENHPLFAVPCPYSRLEIAIRALVPRRDAPVLLIDGDDGVAARAARRLDDLGYAELAVVEGGAPGWAAAGFTLFKGVNVPSKTLGELAEALWHPATLDAATLREWRRSGHPFRLFDARPPAEYAKMRVPGAECVPNGELAHRFAAAIGDSGTPVVVTCAGRTRGLIGAIGLRLAGIPNPIFALENGTQGWALAGEDLERGAAADPFPALGPSDVEASRARARRLSADWNIPWIDMEGLTALRADASRTLYLFDVRSAEEYRRGHVAGAVHAPGGQLVQATDQWVGVRRARIVLADDSGLRAALAAFWLRQLGWETYVLATTDHASSEDAVPAADASPALRLIAPPEAAAGMAAGTHVLLDLRPSWMHRAERPAGAVWTIRPRLARALGARGGAVILMADEPDIAALAAIDLIELGRPDVARLDGGMAAWERAGLPVETDPERPPRAEAIDFLVFVHDRHDGNLESSRRYLAWEQGLVAQLDDAERAEFRLELAREYEHIKSG